MGGAKIFIFLLPYCPKLPTCKTVYAKKVQIVKIFTKGRVVW